MSPLIGNHDKGRFMAYADNDLPGPQGAKDEEVGWVTPPKVDDSSNYAKIELAQAFLLSVDGVPMIYYGDELGMTGGGDPDNRRDMRFGDDVAPAEQRVLRNFESLTRNSGPAFRSAQWQSAGFGGGKRLARFCPCAAKRSRSVCLQPCRKDGRASVPGRARAGRWQLYG